MQIHADIGPFCISFTVSMASIGHENAAGEVYSEVSELSADHPVGFQVEEYENHAGNPTH